MVGDTRQRRDRARLSPARLSAACAT